MKKETGFVDLLFDLEEALVDNCEEGILEYEEGILDEEGILEAEDLYYELGGLIEEWMIDEWKEGTNELMKKTKNVQTKKALSFILQQVSLTGEEECLKQ